MVFRELVARIDIANGVCLDFLSLLFIERLVSRIPDHAGLELVDVELVGCFSLV